MEISYTCTKVPEAVSPNQAFQPHIRSAGVCKTDEIAARVAARTKDDPEMIKSIYAVTGDVLGKVLAQAMRISLDGLCRIELEPRGTFDTEDGVWDPARHSIAAVVIPAAEIRDAAKDLRPVNALKPVTVRLLGVQDATTFEQNAVVKGHTLLCQGKGIKLTAANADEGLYLVAEDGTAHKLAVISSTQGEIDATVPDEVPAGTYVLEVRGRAGNGTNRMLVSARISGFTVRA